MPLGLKNSPATFQSAMDVILFSENWQFALLYLDDSVVFSNTVNDHIGHLKAVLTFLKDAGVTLKLKRCFYFYNKIGCVGQVISPGSLEVAPQVTATIETLNPTSNVTELRSFLGLCIETICAEIRPHIRHA